MPDTNTIMVIVAILAILADVLTTMWALRTNPSAREGNPLIAALMKLGHVGLFVRVLLGLALIWWVQDNPVALAVIGGITFVVAILNARFIR